MQNDVFKIETERLLLKLAGPTEADQMAQYIAQNLERFRSNSPRIQDAAVNTYWQERFQSVNEEYQSQTALTLLIFNKQDTARIIGDLKFDGIIRGCFQACYLGYQLDQSSEGKGLMFEALQAAVRFMFDEWCVHRIMANVQTENVRSLKLLQRLNFVEEGLAKDYLYLDGAWRDHILTSLVNTDYQFR